MRTWLLLTYKIPREPTSSRVYVWRKLKRLGALPLQDAVWVLPATGPAREQMQWLATEISELDGEVTLWEARMTLDGQEETMVRQFVARAESGYREIVDELKRREPDLASLSRRYQQVLAQDFFRCELGRRVRDALVKAGGEPGGSTKP